jgi:hypothetical protein
MNGKYRNLEKVFRDTKNGLSIFIVSKFSQLYLKILSLRSSNKCKREKG